jgi:hypothetical protein
VTREQVKVIESASTWLLVWIVAIVGGTLFVLWRHHSL